MLEPVIGHIMAFFLNLAKSSWAFMELWHCKGALNNDTNIVSCSGITAVPCNEPGNEGLNPPAVFQQDNYLALLSHNAHCLL